MGNHPPIVRKHVPPPPEEVRESAAAVAKRRDELEAAWVEGRPERLRAVAEGPALRDVDAAADCRCGCHPRPADMAQHDGGVTCVCQFSPEEASERRQAAFEAFASFSDDQSEPYELRAERFAAEALDLGVEARIEISAAPFVIVGVVDGRGFYMRERHASYRVTIAPDEDPGSDPWDAGPTVPSIDVASGVEGEFGTYGPGYDASALRVAVAAVRTALLRNRCAHEGIGSAPYCPTCGVPLKDAESWRWGT